ncbi:MAG TPA: hypothetical protein VNY36_02250 [Bacteroidia bacterium]|jgi:hypothetical protein|nr:hypothetical protein [Bacteroidia bacterium]
MRFSIFIATLVFYFITSIAIGQTLNPDSAKIELQGNWRMNADTNVMLMFHGDTMTHKMIRSSNYGKAFYRVTDKNCDTTRFVKEKALYLQEVYRYYHYKTPLNGKICNKIVFLKNGTLILKRDGLFESYTKVKSR